MKRALAALFAAALLLCLPKPAQADAVPARAAYLFEANSGRVLVAQNENAHLEMASTTKIMTALLAIESGRLDETVTVADEAAGTEGSSMYLRAGEKLKLLELVYGLMLRSGNDAAVAIACFLDGGIDAFADRMNARAAQLGMRDTHFTNPNGLHDAAHYTSARDLCVLAAAALENPVFAQIVRTRYRETGGDTPRMLKNKNRLLWEYEGGIGVKTGYTKAAGKCLVFAAERGGLKLVGAVLNCPTMWNTAVSMLDDGFARLKAVLFLNARTEFSVPVKNGTKKALSAAPISGILYPTEIGGNETFEVRASLPPELRAPVYAGDPVGTATLYRNGEAICSVPIVASETVEKSGFFEYLRRAVSDYLG